MISLQSSTQTESLSTFPTVYRPMKIRVSFLSLLFLSRACHFKKKDTVKKHIECDVISSQLHRREGDEREDENPNNIHRSIGSTLGFLENKITFCHMF